jgi:hypothetical protein
MSRLAAGVAALVLFCSGCASVTQGTTHSLRIDTETAQGQVIDDADCELSNDQGTTVARSGASTIVRRSSKDLEIRCTTAGLPDASARLVSRANAGLAGNIIIGGAIGAMVDHNSGAAYTYPSWVKLVFGEYAVLDRRDERDGTVLAATPGATVVVTMRAQAAPGAPAAPPAAAAASATPVAVVATAAAVPTVAVPSRALGVLARGDTFDYRLIDRTTQSTRVAMLRVSRIDDRQVAFNDGSRVEKPNGEVVTLGPPVLGELDNVTPPGGWMPGGSVPRGMWPVRFSTGNGAPGSKSYDLMAQAGREQTIRIEAGQFRAVRVDIEGWYEQVSYARTRAQYRAVVWVSPELRRPIRFEVKSKSPGGSSIFIDETAELIAISRD